MKITLLITAGLLLASLARADGFYQEPARARERVMDLKADFGASGRGAEDDSARLQQAIDSIARSGGGVVRIPAGEYAFAQVSLKSNVHLEIDPTAVIRPYLEGAKKSVAIFAMGRDGTLVENTSIEGVGGRFTVNLSPHAPGIVVVSFGHVRNFKVANVTIHDCLTKFASFQFGPSGGTVAQPVRPRSGTIENASVTGADYGYGLVQVQSAESVLFQNLDGQGGVTLRLETGEKKMNDSQIGGVDRIVGKNISCTEGNAAVMISPHSMQNGVVEIDGVKSTGCGFGVRIDGGFISKKYTAGGLKKGAFARGSTVKNVDATFGMKAQLKPKHYKYMPAGLVKFIHAEPIGPDGASFTGPAIAAVLNDAEYEVAVANVSAHGYEFNPPVIGPKDARDAK